jgi:hypothetical protein
VAHRPCSPRTTTRYLVCVPCDIAVSEKPGHFKGMHPHIHFSSIISPWLTVRKVRVQIEIVRKYFGISLLHSLNHTFRHRLVQWSSAVSEECSMALSLASLEQCFWDIMHFQSFRELFLFFLWISQPII